MDKKIAVVRIKIAWLGNVLLNVNSVDEVNVK